jgi:hypothetical protein
MYPGIMSHTLTEWFLLIDRKYDWLQALRVKGALRMEFVRFDMGNGSRVRGAVSAQYSATHTTHQKGKDWLLANLVEL